MAEQNQDQNAYLEMSDEDIMNMAAPEPVAAADAAATADAPQEGQTTTETTPDAGAGGDDGEAGSATSLSEDEAANGDAGQASQGAAEDDESDVDAAAELDKQAKTEKAAADGAKAPDTTADQPATDKPIDFEAEYKRLMAPFKANGREVSVGSVEDAIALMQMGANYNKKMAALKPNLRIMRMLDNNGLLDEAKLSFLIELDKKNPDAINKLVSDSNLSPMDFDAAKASEYKPKIHSVDEREIALDTVLDEIESSPAYTRTVEIVSKQWDGASKRVVAENPELLRVINSHVESGIYDRIHSEIERERMFGRLKGMSDIEAYRQVGDAIQARGGFNDLGSAQSKTTVTPGAAVVPAPKKVDEAKLNEKRRAASSTKPASPAAKVTSDVNPLALSDEDFAKAADPRFR